MFCHGAIVWYYGAISGTRNGCYNIGTKAIAYLSYSIVTCLHPRRELNTDNSAVGLATKTQLASSAFALHRKFAVPQITAIRKKHHSPFGSSQVFAIDTTTKGWCNVLPRSIANGSRIRSHINCSRLLFNGGQSEQNTSDYGFVRLPIARRVNLFRSCSASFYENVNKYLLVFSRAHSILQRQCCAQSTSSSVKVQLSTVGSQSSKESPAQGSKTDLPALDNEDVTDEMSSQAPEDFKKVSQDEWRKRLDRETFKVCRLKGTEMPGSGKYLRHSEKGTYVCICCRANLFRSEDKFNHCGWPSFRQAMGTKQNGSEETTNVKREYDGTHGMVRTEVLCKKCNSHLGHVFDDGPEPFSRRFCINSVSLDFVKDP
ncbi:uncharacterized protein LOC111254220 [Varroa destructor]|uniref:peptide-methionine (R)-S-oxide reductase n=1 Tax=Varroa destructor TaxID=109461 RepID=A0A7M7L589_VARDE|nr:uncharacterized protein LOC111254220 [Varroa destructor]